MNTRAEDGGLVSLAEFESRRWHEQEWDLAEILPFMSPEDAASFRLIEERVRQAWRDNIVVPCDHAEDMLDDRGIDIFDVRNVLFKGKIVERQQEGECTRYVYRGKSIDGDTLKCVIEIDEHGVIVIVTIFRPGTQGKKKPK